MRSLGAVTVHALTTRRLLLKDMGKAGLAVMVFGVAACSSEPLGGESSSSATDGPSTSSPVSSAANPDTTTSSPGSTTPMTTGDGHSWHRVDLGFVSAYIVYRGGEATIVDTGVDGSSLSIGSGLEEIGLSWNDVGGLILTHKHPDHQGSAQGVLENAPGIPWYAGEGDIASINAPTEGLAVGDRAPLGVSRSSKPRDTPRGHISVLDSIGGFLITGDALTSSDGGLAGPNPGFSEDIDLANASVAKLAGFDYEIVLPGHGEPLLVGGSTAVAELAATLG